MALRPPKTESEIQFEKDLAYLKKISVPLAERREREAIERDARETVERLKAKYEFERPHSGPKSATPILDKFQMFAFIWVVLGIVCIGGYFVVVEGLTWLNGPSMPGRSFQIADQQRQSCERQNSMNADLRENYKYAYRARVEAAKTTSDLRDADIYKMLASKIPMIDCSPDER